MTSETSRHDVRAGVKWLKDHVALDGQDVVAVINQSFLRAMSAQVGGCLKRSGICLILLCLRKALGAHSSIKARPLTMCSAGSSKSGLAHRPAAK